MISNIETPQTSDPGYAAEDLVSSLSIPGMLSSVNKEILAEANEYLKTKGWITYGPVGSSQILFTNHRKPTQSISVVEKGNSFACEKDKCNRFKIHGYCSHVIAAAKKQNKLNEFVKIVLTRQMKSMMKVVNIGKQEGVEKKKQKQTQQRFGCPKVTSTPIKAYLGTQSGM